jgi:hypothetical protein
MKLEVAPRRLLTIFLGISLAFAALGILSQLFHIAGHRSQFGLRDWIDLDGEHNLPALWSTLQLAFAAMMLSLVAHQASGVASTETRYWWILAAVFAFFSIDENISLHERSGAVVRSLIPGTAVMLGFEWALLFIAIAPIIGLLFLRFWLRLPRRTRFLSGLACFLFLGGALGVELLTYVRIAYFPGVWPVFTPLEETMEMTGVSVLIYCAADLIRWRGELVIG